MSISARALGLLLAGSLHAASITQTASTSAQCQYQVVRHPAPAVDVNNQFTSTFSQTTNSVASSSCPSTLLDPSPEFPPVETGNLLFGNHADASVNANYGLIFGDEVAFNVYGNLLSSSQVDAAYSDSATVSGVPSGLLRFTLFETGCSLLLPGSTGGGNIGILTVSGSTFPTMLTGNTGGGSCGAGPPETEMVSFDEPFVAGIPVAFGAELHLIGHGLDLESNDINQSLYIQILDSFGHPINNASLNTASGATYAVPEPSMALMTAVGFLLIAVVSDAVRAQRTSVQYGCATQKWRRR